jgi:small subunit ribosomal protein S26e
MPISTAPYKRQYKHGKGRGKEQMVICEGCGRKVPRYKTIMKVRGMRIRDPALLQQVDKRLIHMMNKRVRYCPACARHRHISKPGISVRKKYGGREKAFGRRRRLR